ncbi:hypothetical protein C1X05_11665 [Laceyella sacchari]|jgi:hypothetical protein|nr:hypothetical protein C1X05_11665 [Laceyella sacchari]
MRQTDERGMALPAVTAVTTLLFTFAALVATMAVRADKAATLYEERMRVKYATETGIAKVQQERSLGKRQPETLLNVGGVMVVVQTEEKEDGTLRVVATGHGERGVRQTIAVLLDQKTLAIIKWIG